MIPRALVAAMVLLTAPLPADALDLRERSDSASNQFSIYCEDRPLRMRVVSFVEEVKRDVLKTLGEREGWKAPIVITIERAAPARAQEPAATVRLVESLPGFKVQIDVRIGRDPSAVNLQRQIVRAVLLEYAYREVGVKGGTEFRDAPWWVIEGCVGLARQREDGPNAAIFQQLLRTNKLPPLENFLSERPDELGATVRALDRALAACLVQLLTAQPGGPAALARLVRAWPQSNGAPLALLKKEFPVIAADEATLQKWWTLNLARFAAADRYRDLLAAGYAEEHARGILPFDYRQHFVVSFTLRALLHFLDLRAKLDAQQEIRTLCDLMWPHLQEWAPQIAEWYEKSRLHRARLAP